MGHYASELGLMDDRPERPEERDSLAEIVHNFEVEGAPLSVEEGRWLINEVKELREENAGLERTIGQDRDAWGRAEARIKQMEEALREKDEEIRHHMSQYMIMGDDDGG